MDFALPFGHIRLPGNVDTVFNSLVSGALVCIKGYSSLRLILCTGGNPDGILDPDFGDLKYAFFVFNISFNISHKVVSRGNSPRIQRGAQGSCQSPGNACNDIIKGGRVFGAFDLPPILLLVEAFDPSMHSEMNGFREVFDVGGSMGSFMFFDSNMAGMG
jgi:hypothetical protein